MGSGSAALARAPANGRLIFTAPSAGVYRVRILADGAAPRRYSLTLSQAEPASNRLERTRGFSLAPPAMGSAVPEAPGRTVSGPLSRFIICPGHPRCPR